MTRLILHIGMHKTGTSALQSTLFRARQQLLTAGIGYLDVADNHSAAFYSLFGKNPLTYRENLRAGINSEEALAAHNDALLKRIKSQLRDNRSETFIISGEDISLLPKDRVPDLRDMLTPYFDQIDVLAYVRSPVSFMHSLAQQAIKGGATIEKLMESPPTPDYKWRFQKFIDAFGEDKVTFRWFDHRQLQGSNILGDFFHTIGVTDKNLLSLPVQQINNSLSRAAARVLSALNKEAPPFLNGTANLRRADTVNAKVAGLDGPNFRLPDAVISKKLPAIRWDIHWMAGFMPEGFDDTADLSDLPNISDLSAPLSAPEQALYDEIVSTPIA